MNVIHFLYILNLACLKKNAICVLHNEIKLIMFGVLNDRAHMTMKKKRKYICRYIGVVQI